MGKYDQPAQIDYVRAQTKVDKVTYIGHSQGTTQMFYAISDDEAFWKQRLNLYIALAPVTKLDNCKSAFMQMFSKIQGLIGSSLDFLHVYSLLGGPSAEGTKIACGVFPQIC